MLCCFLLVGLGAGLVGPGTGGLDSINRNYWGQREQLAGAGDVCGTLAAGEHSIIADGPHGEACWLATAQPFWWLAR
jgi:hypothetical protein